MDKLTRVALLVVFTAIAAWRFSRYVRAGLLRSRRPASLGVAGGVVPQDFPSPASRLPPGPAAPTRSSLRARMAGVLVGAGSWLGVNAALWYCLLEVPPLKTLPPLILGVAGILANFYLIPLARGMGMRSRRRIEEARATATAWPT